ncbi:MAG: DUF1329 domain-containing protein [Gammaproteobacteria bacterium]|nr:DUF1329 domain-containing protein [Gammaproteobacteria bacterium]MBI5618244.1 DUF1329 domain-containing protein [Gammaproteobacteria bacterium]
MTVSMTAARAGVLAALLATAGLAAAENSAPDGSYQALRDWIAQAPEALQPGRTYTAADRAALEAYLPRTVWQYYFFDGMEMEVAPTAHYPTPDNWKMDGSGDYRLDEHGILRGFKGGGTPFPQLEESDPQAAVKLIWNLMWRPGEHDYDMPMMTWLRSENGKLDREMEYMSTNATYAIGDRCLVPGYEEVKSKRIMEFRSPRDMAGAKDMQVVYVDHDREDSGWLYMPAQRKPRRTLASERTSELMGMDMIREDLNGFNGKIHENNWTYLGRRKILATVNVKDNPEMGGPHLWVPNKARWEVRDAYVVMIDPKATDHPYSHRILFIDPDSYWTLWMISFDRKDDQLLRFAQHFTKYSESYREETPQQAPYLNQDFTKNLGHHVFLHLGENDINAKKPHATITHCFVKKRVFSEARAQQFYSLRNMISGRR